MDIDCESLCIGTAKPFKKVSPSNAASDGFLSHAAGRVKKEKYLSNKCQVNKMLLDYQLLVM